MFAIQIKERGPTPRKLLKAHNAASKTSYRDTAKYFHEHLTPKRFTYQHGREANYTKRKGDNEPYGSKAYWQSYMGRKKKQKGHRDPFVWSGKSKAQARRVVVSSTSRGARLTYRIQAFTWHNELKPEFVKILESELIKLGRIYDAMYNKNFKDEKRKARSAAKG